MGTDNKKKQSGTDKNIDQFNKMKIKHDPQAESARVKFGKKK